jgi:hypothetical protein
MDKELTVQQKDSIREGIKSEGFPQFIVDALRIREYESQDKTHVFTLTLDFNSNVALSEELDAYNPLDQLAYIGRRFAKDLQVQMARLLPECRIEDKVIMNVKEYDNLRQRALSCPASPIFDSEFGRQFGTHP